MKVQRLPIYLVVFSFFLACGFLAGRMISSAAQQSLDTQSPDRQETNIQHPSRLAFPLPNLDALTKDPESTSSQLQSNTDKGQAPIQQNILVIGVDKLQSPRPRLESIWLILYFTDNTHLTLMPIYPAIPVDETGSTMGNTTTEQSFEIGTDHKPGNKLFSTLKDKNIWWNGYLVLDNSAMAELVDFLAYAGGVFPSNQSGANVIASLPLARENPHQALRDQTKLLQELCSAAAQQSNIPDLSSLYDSITEHVVSDLDLHQLINEWQIRLTQSGRVTCEFPFLNPQ